MFDQFQEMQQAIEMGSSPAVQLWINWMGIVFMASILFVWKHKSARMALGAMLLTLPLAFFIYNMSGSIHLIGIAHMVFWGPLTYYLISHEIRTPAFNIKSTYNIWLVLLTATIIISLIFDVRDTYLVLMGQK